MLFYNQKALPQSAKISFILINRLPRFLVFRMKTENEEKNLIKTLTSFQPIKDIQNKR